MLSFSAMAAAFMIPILPLTMAQAATGTFPPGVLGTGTMGPTNPPQPTLGTPINQNSMARLLSVNSIDTIEVAWCTKPRNNARLIPDGTIKGVSFLKTDFYVQLIGYADLTKINIPAGDFGGELDPHGQFGAGNPIGGNVTSNITGSDENFAEWSGNGQFCMRVCTNANSTYSAEHMCWHELDEMGCEFVMPGNYNVNGTFETCDADVAYPPGWYPTATVNGTPVFSTFAQRFTGTLPGGSVYTVGDLTTPSAPFSTPRSSNCVTTSSISNGIDLANPGATNTATAGGTSASNSAVAASRSGAGSPSAPLITDSPTSATGGGALAATTKSSAQRSNIGLGSLAAMTSASILLILLTN
ncbi:hypothetical protein D9619_008507 [Psilocybe cf. subviscida]|uniref:Uncharacterized protein n=1 Tax=Psilocybe cf. subviscida TaxID=2480587 RepID=A0A8H5B9H7_9AGAR|nr:hypothetical protein D9619_008507 [Psilocybe cf. subviscida]